MDVKFSRLARRDFKDIALYLALNAGEEIANKVTNEIERVIFSLWDLFHGYR